MADVEKPEKSKHQAPQDRENQMLNHFYENAISR